MQHVSRSLISSTETLSDEALAISIKSFLLHNLDNIFVFSFQRNDRIKSCLLQIQSETAKVLDLDSLKIAKFAEFALARDQVGINDLNISLE
jgi:hypothetical protein